MRFINGVYLLIWWFSSQLIGRTYHIWWFISQLIGRTYHIWWFSSQLIGRTCMVQFTAHRQDVSHMLVQLTADRQDVSHMVVQFTSDRQDVSHMVVQFTAHRQDVSCHIRPSDIAINLNCSFTKSFYLDHILRAIYISYRRFNPMPVEFIYLATFAESAESINRPTAVKGLHFIKKR